jgi:hypothetical protein
MKYFSAFSLSTFKFGVWSFDIQSLSAFGHSVLGPYSALGPIWPSVIRPSVIRPFLFRPSVIRPFVIRPFVFRPYVGESMARPHSKRAMPGTATSRSRATHGMCHAGHSNTLKCHICNGLCRTWRVYLVNALSCAGALPGMIRPYSNRTCRVQQQHTVMPHMEWAMPGTTSL